jgi:hypothetical protein
LHREPVLLRANRASASASTWAYNYNDVLQNALICFNDMPATGVVLPLVTGAGSCAALDPANPLLTSTTRISEWRR